VVAGELLGAVNGYGVAMGNQVALKLLVADQPVDESYVGLFQGLHFDIRQQPVEGIVMRQGFQFRKQQPQILKEHRQAHIAVGFSPRGHLENERQQSIQQHHGQLVFDGLGVARIRDPRQALQ